jgi:hypothetical protein
VVVGLLSYLLDDHILDSLFLLRIVDELDVRARLPLVEVANDHFVNITHAGIFHLEFMSEDLHGLLSEQESVLWLTNSVCVVSKDLVEDDIGDCVLLPLALDADFPRIV